MKTTLQKTTRRLLFAFVVLFTLFSVTSSTQAQTITENFEEDAWTAAGTSCTTSTVVVSSYIDGTNATLNTGSWRFNIGGFITVPTSSSKTTMVHSGTRAFRVGGNNASYIMTPLLPNGVTSITFYLRAGAAAGATVSVIAGTNTTSSSPGGWYASFTANVSHSSVSWSSLSINITGAASSNPCYLKINRSAGDAYIDDIVITSPTGGSTPPTLSAAGSQPVDDDFAITFTDDATWRGVVTGITVDGTSYLLASGAYTLTSGSLSLSRTSISQLNTAGSHTVAVLATGYTNASVTQTNIAGAATKLAIKTALVAPTTNGGAFATQPQIYIQDQYGNTTTSTASVSATATSDAWTIGGSEASGKAASAGVAVFTNLTAGHTQSLTGATVTFSCGSLTTVNSATFNIPAPTATQYTVSGTTDICSDGNTDITLSGSNVNVDYQLYKGASASGGTKAGTGSALTWNVLGSAGAATYTVKTVASAYSTAATMNGDAVITVNTAPSITASQLAGNTYAQGTVSGSVTSLSVTASNATSYLWKSSPDESNATPGDDADAAGTNDAATYSPSTASVGTTYYYCIVSGTSPCSAINSDISGAIVISAVSDPLIGLTSAGATEVQTVVAGTAITTITYLVGGSGTTATIEWTGTASSSTAPTGITGSVSGLDVTISGTPSVAGEYTYTVTTDGSPAASDGGTITVKLLAPTVGSPSDATNQGFTANWTSVANANSYDIQVYQDAIPVGSPINANGQATESKVITGLSANTSYTYKVTAVGNGTTTNSAASSASASVRTLSTASAITAFSITGQNSSTISGTDITVEVPYSTSRASLTTSISVSAGANVSPASGTTEDFTSPVQYTVTAEDGTTQQVYTVTVSNAAASSACDITAFTFTGQVSSTIDGTNISVVMPAGTYRHSLAPSGITTSAQAAVSPLATTAQDFRTAKVYTVTAEDNTTKQYTVTVTNQPGSTNYTFNVNAATKIVQGTTPKNYWEVTGVGKLMRDATGNTNWPTSTGGTDCFGLGTVYLNTANSIFALQTYNTITSFTIYGTAAGTDNRTLSSVEVGTTTANYAAVTATATGAGDNTFTIENACDSMRIVPQNPIAANSYVKVTMSGNIRIYKIVFRNTTYAAAPLTAPTVGTASAITTTGFTANWTDGSDELGYTVKVYDGSSALVKTVSGIAANATSTVITDLSANTNYTYKVTAIADGDMYADSNESSASAVRTLNTAKLITSFALGVAGETAAVIDNDAATVAITVPFGTDVTALTPTVGVSTHATYGPSGAQNFTTPKEYTVTAEDASEKIYTVTVTIASGDQPTNTFTSVGNGNWTTTATWKSTPNGVDDFTPTSAPGTQAAVVNIAHKITVPASSAVSATDIVVEPTASLTVENSGTLTIPVSGTIILKSDDTGTAQLKNDGTITNNGVVIVRKTIRATGGWSLISFPFDVPANKIFLAGTTTPASWGNILDNGTDFYVAEYDAQKRDETGIAVKTNSPNWKSVSGQAFAAKKGYIIAVDADITLDFVSGLGETAMFDTQASTTLITTNATNLISAHHNWNLVGVPFTTSFELEQASQDQAPFYYFNGLTYITVMTNETYEASPFTAIFLQSNPEASTPAMLSFSSAGRLVKSVAIPNFDEISLIVKNAKYNDKTRIRLQDGALAGYEIGKDAMKFFSPNLIVPQIACKQDGLDLSVNSVPINTTKVDVSVTIGEDGTYTISLEDVAKAAGCSQVILVDGEVETDLLAGDSYSFAGTAGSTKNLSVLLVAEGTTAVGTAQGGSILIQTIGNKAYIKGLEGAATVSVYDVAGKLAQRFTNVNNNDALSLSNAGIYVIDVKTATQAAKAKVSVNK